VTANPVIEPADPKKLQELDDKIRVLKLREAPRKAVRESHSQTEVGWRMVTELVAGLLIGIGVGFGLDSLLGTIPIFLILFTLLGFGAGINVMLRSARELQLQNETEAQATDEKG